MARTPLLVLLSPVEELVLFGGQAVAGLTHFELNATTHIETRYTCCNCFPRRSGQHVADMGKSLETYPLHVYVGDDVNDLIISHDGRILGPVRALFVALDATEKRIVRLTTYTPLPDKVNTALLDLGVEVIIEPPDDTQSAGDADAHL